LNIKVLEETFGITEKSLTALRNELARRVDHRLKVFTVPAADNRQCLGYGVLILDESTDEAVIVGDGFRGDGGGEGGAGYRACEALLALFGLHPTYELENPVAFDQGRSWDAIVKVAQSYDEPARKPSELTAQYIDWVG
jgi:hypothetical protein